jgi:hypothetical protein
MGIDEPDFIDDHSDYYCKDCDDFDVCNDCDDVKEPDPEHEESLYLKFCFEGFDSLRGLASGLRALADEFDGRAMHGWVLEHPVESGWVHMWRT